MHLFGYVQNDVQDTVLFFSKLLGKVLIFALLIIAPLAGIEAFCSGSLSQLDVMVSHHQFSFMLLRWFFLILVLGTIAYIIWGLEQFTPDSFDDLGYCIAQRINIGMGMVICELILCENIFLILLHYWKHH